MNSRQQRHHHLQHAMNMATDKLTLPIKLKHFQLKKRHHVIIIEAVQLNIK